MADKRARNGEDYGDLTEGELHGANDQADDGVPEKRAKGAAFLYGDTKSEEETGADRAGNA